MKNPGFFFVVVVVVSAPLSRALLFPFLSFIQSHPMRRTGCAFLGRTCGSVDNRHQRAGPNHRPFGCFPGSHFLQGFLEEACVTAGSLPLCFKSLITHRVSVTFAQCITSCTTGDPRTRMLIAKKVRLPTHFCLQFFANFCLRASFYFLNPCTLLPQTCSPRQANNRICQRDKRVCKLRPPLPSFHSILFVPLTLSSCLPCPGSEHLSPAYREGTRHIQDHGSREFDGIGMNGVGRVFSVRLSNNFLNVLPSLAGFVRSFAFDRIFREKSTGR